MTRGHGEYLEYPNRFHPDTYPAGETEGINVAEFRNVVAWAVASSR